MANNYSKRDLKRMLKRGASVPIDAPSFILKKIDERRKKFNREALSMEEEMDIFMEENARRWMPVKRPTWANWFKRILGRPTRFANRFRSLINR